ncbi:unnamed protein product [Schistosoma margrebowiei]|uniref:Uncharacterized protein n=1 Tax=Schistosoma margrebowiei TaxID=48269 RepID=A0AA85A900_9TREM|nr:unnamed protein product [Schistosoma margrebowiei]
MMINSNGDRKPRRSSLKFTFDPVNDASDGIVSSRGLNRRVSFSQYVFVLGDEDDGSQMCVSRFNSNISVEDEFATTNNDINNNDNNGNDYKNDNSSNINDNMESITSISDVSMELSPDSCLKVKHESFSEQQNTNMEVDNDADSRTLSSKCSSLESITISSLDEMMIVKNELSCTPRHHHDVSDMEVQSSICPLPLPINEELCNMSIISTNELNLSTNNDGNIDKNLPGDSLPHKIYSQPLYHNDVPDITPTIKNNEDVNHEKILTPPFRSPHFLQSTNTMMMTDIVDPLLSDKRPVSVVKMPLINLNLSNSLPLTRRRCNINNNLQSDVDKTPKPSESERITFVSLINTPLRQANIGDDTGANLTSVKKVIRPKTFRDVNEYKPEKLLSNTRRLHNHLRNQLAECQLEAVIDHIKYDFSNIKSIVNFLRKNEYIDCNLETLDKSTLLTDMDQYGSDEYLRLQNQLHLHLYDKLVKRRFVIETENINRLEFWKRLYLERISTVLISPQLKSVTKNVSEMNLIEHLKFMAGAQQLFHTCSKFAQQEIYQIIDENISARNLELNLEIDNLNQLNDYLELMISRKQSELKQKRQEREQLLELKTYAKEILQKLNRIKQEINETTQRQIVIRQSNKKLLQRKQHLEKKLKELSEKNRQEELYNSSTLVNRSIGCTELFPIPISETSIIQHCNNNDRSRLEPIVTRQLINLFSPCRITCTSFDKDNHMYEVSTLFGLVNFLLTCQVCNLLVDDTDRKNNNNHQCNESIDGNDDGDDDEDDDDDDMQTTVNPENLKVISVQVVAPTDVECPVECPPVESVARICIEYLNTVGYDNLRTRCIGFTMADVIETIETIIVPFMVLASDLRSLWLVKCDVNLVMTSIDDQLFTGGYFTPKKLRNLIGQTPRSTAVHSLSTSHRTPFQSKQLHHQSIIGESITPVEKSLSFNEYLTPSEPFSITVKFSTRNYRIMVRFTLMSLDYMDSSQGSVEFEVLRGNLRTEKLEEYFKTCKPTCGNLYSIISKLQLFLSSSV